MKWPLERRPVPTSEVPYYNLQYLHGCSSPADPTMLWGTEVDAATLQSYVDSRNRNSKALVSVVHVLLQAVGKTLARFPSFNCRLVRRRIFRFRECNVRLSTYNRRRREVDLVLLKNADTLTLEQIARVVWKNQHKSAQGDARDRGDRRLVRRLPGALLGWGIRGYLWLDRNFRLPSLRLYRLSNAPVLVNYFGFAGAPPLRVYKPSRYPDETSHLSITMGRIEPRPVVSGGEVVSRPLAPLFVRADHRIVDAYELAQFVRCLMGYLEQPASMEAGVGVQPSGCRLAG